MLEYIQSHGLVVMIVGWILANAISSMPTPRDNASQFYEWLFKFAQAVGGAIPRVLAIYKPAALAKLTGQTPKETIPPNPPISASEVPEVKP